jgi:hypothetical protein
LFVIPEGNPRLFLPLSVLPPPNKKQNVISTEGGAVGEPPVFAVACPYCLSFPNGNPRLHLPILLHTDKKRHPDRGHSQPYRECAVEGLRISLLQFPTQLKTK